MSQTLKVFAAALLSLAISGAAYGQASLELTPDPGDVGDVLVGASGMVTFTLSNVGDAPADVSNVSISGANSGDFSEGLTSFTINGGESVPIEVTCSPSAAGARSANLDVASDAATNPNPSVGITCNGIKPDIAVNPAVNLNFIDTDVGDSRNRNVRVTNNGEAPLTVSFSTSGPQQSDFSFVDPGAVVIAPSDEFILSVTFSPGDYTPDPRAATLRIASDDQETPVVNINLRGTGLAADIDAPIAVAFSDTRNGETSDEIITIENDGNKTLTLSSVTVTNAPGQSGFSLVGSPPTSIAAGSSTNVTVRFSPDAAQTFTGNLVITSDDPDSGLNTTMLSGRGLSVTSAFINAPMNFGDIDLSGGAVMRSVQIRNTGEADWDLLSVSLLDTTNFSISGAPPTGVLAPNESATVIVQSNLTETGDVSTQIQFTTDIPGVPVLLVNLNAVGIDPAITSNIPAIPFDGHDIQLATPAVRTVDIQNTGTGSLNIVSLTVTGTAAGLYTVTDPTSVPFVIAEGASRTVTVNYDPIAEGPGDDATLEVLAENRPVLNISLSGRGIDRHIETATGTVVFPPTYRNPAQPTEFRLNVMNTGEAPLAINSVMLANTDDAFSVAQSSPMVIERQSVGTITLQFAPKSLSTEPFTGQLIIMNDDTSSPMVIVPLEGVSILPNVTVSPDVIDFGQVGVGVTSEVGLRVPIISVANLEADVAHTIRGIRIADTNGIPVDSDLFVVRGLPEPRALAAGDTLELELEFRPVTAGQFEFVLELIVGEDSLPVRTAPVRAEAVEVKLRGGGCRAGGETSSVLGILLFLGIALMTRRRQRQLSKGALLGTLILAANALVGGVQAAHAQSTRDLEIGNFRAAQGTALDFVTVDSARVGNHRSWSLSLSMDHASNPLSVSSGAAPGVSDTPVSRRTAFELGGAVAFWDRFEVAASVPLILSAGAQPMISGIEPADGTSIGDVTARGKMSIAKLDALALAAAVSISLPTASSDMFAGAAGFGITGRGIAAIEVGPALVTANVGIRARQRGRLGDVIQGNDLVYAGAGAFRVAKSFSVIAEFFGAFGLSGSQTAGTSPLEVLAGAQYRATRRMSFVGGVSRGVLGGIGSPDVRGFVAACWQAIGIESEEEPVDPATLVDPDADDDGDKIKNGVDKCISDAEDKDGFEDDDGCPDLDNDGDRIVDSADKCPNEPEDIDKYQDEDGCIDRDNDGDGILDPVDKCPMVPEDSDGFQDEDGCDDPDNDQDGVPDFMDACPLKPETKNGFKDADGCPDKKRRRRR